VFYVKDLFGLKVSHDSKLEQIKTRLLAAIADPDEVAGSAKPVAAPA